MFVPLKAAAPPPLSVEFRQDGMGLIRLKNGREERAELRAGPKGWAIASFSEGTFESEVTNLSLANHMKAIETGKGVKKKTAAGAATTVKKKPAAAAAKKKPAVAIAPVAIAPAEDEEDEWDEPAENEDPEQDSGDDESEEEEQDLGDEGNDEAEPSLDDLFGSSDAEHLAPAEEVEVVPEVEAVPEVKAKISKQERTIK